MKTRGMLPSYIASLSTLWKPLEVLKATIEDRGRRSLSAHVSVWLIPAHSTIFDGLLFGLLMQT